MLLIEIANRAVTAAALEKEILAAGAGDLAAARAVHKCSRPSAVIAAKIAKCLSDPLAPGLFFAVIVLKSRAEELSPEPAADLAMANRVLEISGCLKRFAPNVVISAKFLFGRLKENRFSVASVLIRVAVPEAGARINLNSSLIC